jgi:hypothetical protein
MKKEATQNARGKRTPQMKKEATSKHKEQRKKLH